MDEETKYTLATGHSVIFTHLFRINLSKKQGTTYLKRKLILTFVV